MVFPFIFHAKSLVFAVIQWSVRAFQFGARGKVLGKFLIAFGAFTESF